MTAVYVVGALAIGWALIFAAMWIGSNLGRADV